jgi:hypothetical protein
MSQEVVDDLLAHEGHKAQERAKQQQRRQEQVTVEDADNKS